MRRKRSLASIRRADEKFLGQYRNRTNEAFRALVRKLDFNPDPEEIAERVLFTIGLELPERVEHDDLRKEIGNDPYRIAMWFVERGMRKLGYSRIEQFSARIFWVR